MKKSKMDIILICIGAIIFLCPWVYGVMHLLLTSYLLAQENVSQVNMTNLLDSSLKWVTLGIGIVVMLTGILIHLNNAEKQE